MMTPFPPKLIAARHCEHWRTRACARVGSLRFARFGFPPHGRACARGGVNFVNFGPLRALETPPNA